MMYISEIKEERETVTAPTRSFRAIATQRRRQKNRILLQRFAIMAIAVILAILGICLFAPSAKAKAENDSPYVRHIVSVRVVENDSLWKIAERFYCSEKESIQDFVEDIKEINHLDGNTIYPDTYLIIPYYIKK